VRDIPHTFRQRLIPSRKTLWRLRHERDRERGIVIASFPFDILDYKETNMKNARLIKRSSLSERSPTEDHRKADSQPVVDAKKSAMKWVRERQELRQINPRRQIAALFRTAG
jgi:hypothetical protein